MALSTAVIQKAPVLAIQSQRIYLKVVFQSYQVCVSGSHAFLSEVCVLMTWRLCTCSRLVCLPRARATPFPSPCEQGKLVSYNKYFKFFHNVLLLRSSVICSFIFCVFVLFHFETPCLRYITWTLVPCVAESDHICDVSHPKPRFWDDKHVPPWLPHVKLGTGEGGWCC